MDATMQTVLRLHEQGIPRRTIAKRAGISLQKVRKILITAGAWSDETSEKIGKLRANGMSVPEIAEELGLTPPTIEIVGGVKVLIIWNPQCIASIICPLAFSAYLSFP